VLFHRLFQPGIDKFLNFLVFRPCLGRETRGQRRIRYENGTPRVAMGRRPDMQEWRSIDLRAIGAKSTGIRPLPGRILLQVNRNTP
jgi:hypothetical protein